MPGRGKRKRRQSVCSATVRYAGICPAAAAGSEYDYSTRNEILIIASRSMSISIIEVHNHCVGTVITIFCRRPITLREEFFYIFLQLGGGDFFGSHKPAVQIVLVRHHVPKLAARGQEPAAVPTAAAVAPSHSPARPSPTLVELPAKEQAMMQKTAL